MKKSDKKRLKEVDKTLDELIELIELSQTSYFAKQQFTRREIFNKIEERLKVLRGWTEWTEKNRLAKQKLIDEKKEKLITEAEKGKKIEEVWQIVGEFAKNNFKFLFGVSAGIGGAAAYHHIKKKKKKRCKKEKK